MHYFYPSHAEVEMIQLIFPIKVNNRNNSAKFAAIFSEAKDMHSIVYFTSRTLLSSESSLAKRVKARELVPSPTNGSNDPVSIFTLATNLVQKISLH